MHTRIVFPDRQHYNIEYTDEVMSLVNLLLKKDRTERLGAREDAYEILQHPWFSSIDIDKLERYKVVPPFMPAGDLLNTT